MSWRVSARASLNMVMNMRELPIIVTILNSLKDMSHFYICHQSAVYYATYLVSLSKWTAFICTCLPTSINTIYLPFECSWPVVLCEFRVPFERSWPVVLRGFADPIYYLQYVEFFDVPSNI